MPGSAATFALQLPRVQVDVCRGDESADAGTLVALLDLVPPALGLVLQHGRLFDEDLRIAEEIEECAIGTGDGGEELPAGEDGDAAGGDGTRDEIGGSVVSRPLPCASG